MIINVLTKFNFTYFIDIQLFILILNGVLYFCPSNLKTHLL